MAHDDATYHVGGTRVIDALHEAADELWEQDAHEALGWPDTNANLSDFARLALLTLAHRTGHPNVIRLYREFTAVADVLNLAPISPKDV